MHTALVSLFVQGPLLSKSDFARASRCMKFNSDGRFLATGGKDGLVKVWEVVDKLPPTPLQVWHLAFFALECFKLGQLWNFFSHDGRLGACVPGNLHQTQSLGLYNLRATV